VPRTILSLASTLARSGPMHVLMSLVRHLDPLRYRAVVVTLSPEPAGSLMEEMRQMGIEVRQMGLTRAESAWAGRRTLRRLVAEIGPDLMHTHGIRADFLAVRAGLPLPIASTLHCDLRQDYGLAWGRAAGALLAAAHYAALRRFDGVAAVSESVAEAARREGVRARAIPNGVETSDFRRALEPGRRAALRGRFGWPARAMVVLHTGSLSARKNPLQVLKAFCASAYSSRGLLVFAGDGPCRAECEKAAGGKRNVLFLGKRNDIPDLLAAADLLVTASLAEGFPMAVLEGCASGISVAASDIPPHRAIHALFPGQVRIVNGWEGMRAALDGIAAGDAGKRHEPDPAALESISSRRMAEGYQELYTNLLHAGACACVSAEEAVRCP
jgi:glycosyltransferase involved in cell wall biosynthesis